MYLIAENRDFSQKRDVFCPLNSDISQKKIVFYARKQLSEYHPI